MDQGRLILRCLRYSRPLNLTNLSSTCLYFLCHTQGLSFRFSFYKWMESYGLGEKRSMGTTTTKRRKMWKAHLRFEPKFLNSLVGRGQDWEKYGMCQHEATKTCVLRTGRGSAAMCLPEPPPRFGDTVAMIRLQTLLPSPLPQKHSVLWGDSNPSRKMSPSSLPKSRSYLLFKVMHSICIFLLSPSLKALQIINKVEKVRWD